MACQSTTVRIGAAYVSWGRKESTCVTPVLGLAGGEYFEISSKDTDYYVWTNVDAGSSDPAPAGKTGIQVAVTAGYDALDWCGAFRSGVELTGDFWGDLSDDQESVLVTVKEVGAPLSPTADVDTGFSLEQIKSGVGGDLGKTEGGIEVTKEISSQEIATDQTGTAPIDEIVTGVSVSAAMSLLEMTADKWALVVGEVSGSNFTPAGGTQVTGMGTARIFQSLFNLGGELNLHPVEKDAADLSADITFVNCAPLPESYNFSSEETSKMAVSFKALIDSRLDSRVNMMVYGDATQDLR